jgi:CheY-like chemotaxis protein
VGRVIVADLAIHPGCVRASPTVLVVDDDDDIAALVEEVLEEEGYAVTILKDAGIEEIQQEVAQIQPDCILLDGGVGSGYGESWESAALVARLTPAIPIVMFTAHTDAVAEAIEKTSERSQVARFAAVLTKPFELTELIRVVGRATSGDSRAGHTEDAVSTTNVVSVTRALDSVLVTEELTRRPARSPDLQAENAALQALARQMAEGPDHLLRRSCRWR